MDEKIKELINRAIEEEEFFMNFYLDASNKTDVESAKELLVKLSEQEKGHKAKLKALDIENIKTNSEVTEDLGIAQELMLTPINEFNKLKDIFDFAIKCERGAGNKYEKLAEYVLDQGMKDIFNMLSDEEKKHEELLKNELERMEI